MLHTKPILWQNLDGVVVLSDAAQRDIKYKKYTEVTYLLPCHNQTHVDAAITPTGEDVSELIFQLYKSNVVTEKVYSEDDVLNLTTRVDTKSEISTVGKKTHSRLNELNKHLEALEKAANLKGIAFDKRKLQCSKKELLKWLQTKPGSHFNIASATFNDTWKLAKDYGLCSPSSTKPNFFTEIQG